MSGTPSFTISAAHARSLLDTRAEWSRNPSAKTMPQLYHRITTEAAQGFSNLIIKDWPLSAEDRAELIGRGYRLHIVEETVLTIEW
jgi:hypothetical protein